MQKFLDLHGKQILFTYVEGQYWVAIKPICEALDVNYNRQFQNIKKDYDLSELFAEQQTHDSINRLQEMVCLTKKLIYGWLLSMNYTVITAHLPQKTERTGKPYQLFCRP